MINTDNPRDTQFRRFAFLVIADLVANHSMALNWDKYLVEIELIIARRAYDLVKHTIEEITMTTRELYTDREILELIPDLTEWLSNP